MDREALVAELWRRYKTDQDLHARDFLVTEYSPWARMVAAGVYRRTGRTGLEWVDHLQNAHVGLLEAIVRFDPGKHIPFVLYAKQRVRGAVFNGIRQHTRSRRLEDQQARATLEGDGVEDFIATILDIATQHLLEQTVDAWPGQGMLEQQAKHILSQAMLQLAPRSREVFMSYYYLHKPFVQIAGELGVTKGRVSQLHKQGLEILRQYFSCGSFCKGDFL
ncbi:sigma-70 family RNA polymerase sigma factor [Xanthomonas cucurbitae]|uniref:Sigma-70 family RNA polymerase sigma factor n=1 Tax=Xanthomonas cucurbitae TaxID=56453 RepID=A0ABY7YCZ0_9XANT|nr:sigma-70 family RNA polymerase sigma factor [Xanthomonas cucurbitae]WDM67835.1 sigma-70 family RNA polymerase sigma factor [Xanthomonas cucurbitae]WDM71709.1 sigma-70 family RNA polymerase sigma factor [Xanthomonas cucurbitae]